MNIILSLLQLLSLGCFANTIVPLEKYTIPAARELAAVYQAQLEKVADQVYACTIPPGKGPWGIIPAGGLSFGKIIGNSEEQGIYLSLMLSVTFGKEDAFYRQSVDDQASGMISRYGMGLLRVMSSNGALANDPRLSGFGVIVAWPTLEKDPSGKKTIVQSAAFYVKKEALAKCLTDVSCLDGQKQELEKGAVTVYYKGAEKQPDALKLRLSDQSFLKGNSCFPQGR